MQATFTTTIIEVESEPGVIIPENIMQELSLATGDEVEVVIKSITKD